MEFYLPKKSLLVVSGGGEWQTKFSVSPGPGLWSIVLGPFGPDLGPDLDLTWDLDLDLSLTISDVKTQPMSWLALAGQLGEICPALASIQCWKQFLPPNNSP